MHQLILAILLAWPAFGAEPTPERPEDRAARLDMVATVIEATALSGVGRLTPTETAAVLLSLGFHESRFAAYVGEGRCSEGPEGARCDKGMARTYWQLHRAACPRAWAEPQGSEAELRAAAKCAASIWAGARGRCRGRHQAGDIAGAFSGYRSAYCSWRGAVRRRDTYWATIVRVKP